MNVHVIPGDDLVRHEASGECACGPRIERRVTDCGDLWLSIHHSLARSEFSEVIK